MLSGARAARSMLHRLPEQADGGNPAPPRGHHRPPPPGSVMAGVPIGGRRHVDARLAEGVGQDSDGTIGQALMKSRRRRGERLAGCPRATDDSTARQIADLKVGQEARGRPGTDILDVPRPESQGHPEAPALHSHYRSGGPGRRPGGRSRGPCRGHRRPAAHGMSPVRLSSAVARALHLRGPTR